MPEYDVGAAFERIENELISSMIRNMSRHLNTEADEGIEYTQWQAEQLKELRKYQQQNPKKFKRDFEKINRRIDEAIKEAYKKGGLDEEAKLLEAVKSGAITAPADAGIGAAFFAVNSGKVNALIESTTNDFKNAEKAILRRSNDIYRKTIFNTQMFLNTGAGSLRQAIDMAAKDFLSAGIDCIQYKNGARVNAASYAEMALRTANKRANMVGAAGQRDKYGIHTVYVSAHNSACPMCAEWQGRVYIDNVYGSGTPDESKESGYPLLSDAIAGGMFHPNCRNGTSAWIAGVSTEPTPPTEEQKAEQIENYKLQQEQRYNERQIRKYKRLSENSVDDADKVKYTVKLEQWQKQQRDLIKANPDKLRRKYDREKIYTQEKVLTNAAGKPIIKTDRNSLKGKPNSIMQKESSKGGIERNYYGENGMQKKQVSNNDHGKPKKHPYGKKGEHAHDYIYDENGKLIDRPMRELNDEERKENADILWKLMI